MQSISESDVRALEGHALAIRKTIIEMLAAAGSGHTSGPLGMADIFAALYFRVMKHDPKNPDWTERDRLFLSNGHICPVRYAAMAHSGYFPVEECLTLRKFGSRLQGHPERDMLPGVETTSGPLGSGISQAAGYALAARMDGKDFRVFCATSDGEHQEGNTWEGVMLAGKYRLTNLTAIMDRNNIQIDGNTEDIMPLEPLADKYRAFNWHVIEVDGHNIRQFIEACDEAKSIKEKPTMILAYTTPGKGVPSIEHDYRWHGNPPGKGPTDKIPADKQKEEFLRELDASAV
jgi:transketolase